MNQSNPIIKAFIKVNGFKVIHLQLTHTGICIERTINFKAMPYIYLVQPVELVGTNRYKIGMSSLNNLNRIRSYKNGTRHLFICECVDALYVERKLIEAFNKEYKLIGGREYFEVDCEMKMMNLFISIVMSYNNRKAATAKPTNKVILADKKNIDLSEDNKSVITPMSWMNKFGYQSKSH